MNTQKKIISVVVVLILIGVSFYGGMTYGESETPARGNFPAGAGFGGVAGTRGGFARGGAAGGSAAAGQVISATASNMTIKLASDSTQIVELGTSTTIAKSVSGSTSDLTAGTNVIVTGSTNSDGSITATSVQIRPVMPTKQQ